MQLRRCAWTDAALRLWDRLRYYGVNSDKPPLEKSQPSRISKSAVVVMLVIIGALALLAVFANVQRFRRGQVETVVIRPATTPAPQAR